MGMGLAIIHQTINIYHSITNNA